MPLPSNCALSLLGHSRPGDTVHSKPKQAIIIRLSTEILDALEANPDAIKVDFSGSPARTIFCPGLHSLTSIMYRRFGQVLRIFP